MNILKFLWKFSAQLFCTYILCWYMFFVNKKLANKLLIKCWWNWSAKVNLSSKTFLKRTFGRTTFIICHKILACPALIVIWRKVDLGSISSTFYAHVFRTKANWAAFLWWNWQEVNFTNILCTTFMSADHKCPKMTVKSSVLFALLRSAQVKAACKMLVKSTPVWYVAF